MDLLALIRRMMEDGTFQVLAGNPLAQFGTTNRAYLGPTVLPERLVSVNEYRESQIRYRTLVALDGTRYSPAQKRPTGELIGEFLVELGHQDIASELTSRDYDALLQLLSANASMQAEASILGWADLTINRALIERTEIQRWQAIVDAEVVRVGDNGYSETVSYPNPAGHRAAAGGNWSTDSYDPMDDIMAMNEMMADKGYRIGRLIGSRRVMSILARNEIMAQRAGRYVRVTDSNILMQGASTGDVNAVLGADDLPPVEMYDLTYFTPSGIERFFPNDVLVGIAATGQDEQVGLAEDMRYIPNTAGYTAIGRPAGQPGPGRVLRVDAFDNKPPRLEAEGWQTSLPVITDPESIFVITGIQ